MDNFQTNRILHIISVKPAQAESRNLHDIPPLLPYGGVAVAVIIALTYYNQVLLKLITKLVSSSRENK